MDREDRQSSTLKSEETPTLPYDPSKFSYEEMSDSASVNAGSSSAPSPMDVAESNCHKILNTKSSVSTSGGITPRDTDVPIEPTGGRDTSDSCGSLTSSR